MSQPLLSLPRPHRSEVLLAFVAPARHDDISPLLYPVKLWKRRLAATTYRGGEASFCDSLAPSFHPLSDRLFSISSELPHPWHPCIPSDYDIFSLPPGSCALPDLPASAASSTSRDVSAIGTVRAERAHVCVSAGALLTTLVYRSFTFSDEHSAPRTDAPPAPLAAPRPLPGHAACQRAFGQLRFSPRFRSAGLVTLSP